MRKFISLFFFFTLAACSTKTVHDSAKKSEVKVTNPVVEDVGAKTAAPQPKIEAAPPAPAVAHHELHREKGPIEADSALKLLKSGNQRFRKGFLRKDGIGSADRERLAKGQKPYAIVVSCSDSRVPPELVFDQRLGELFVVRNAGQVADNATLASIEYAIEHLGSNLIVVMGHESCGAVKAAHGSFTGGLPPSPYLQFLIKEIQPRIELFSSTPISVGALDESWANVIGASKDLLARSEVIRSAVESGDVKIARALYHLGSGVVEWK